MLDPDAKTETEKLAQHLAETIVGGRWGFDFTSAEKDYWLNIAKGVDVFVCRAVSSSQKEGSE